MDWEVEVLYYRVTVYLNTGQSFVITGTFPEAGGGDADAVGVANVKAMIQSFGGGVITRFSKKSSEFTTSVGYVLVMCCEELLYNGKALVCIYELCEIVISYSPSPCRKGSGCSKVQGRKQTIRRHRQFAKAAKPFAEPCIASTAGNYACIDERGVHGQRLPSRRCSTSASSPGCSRAERKRIIFETAGRFGIIGENETRSISFWK